MPDSTVDSESIKRYVETKAIIYLGSKKKICYEFRFALTMRRDYAEEPTRGSSTKNSNDDLTSTRRYLEEQTEDFSSSSEPSSDCLDDDSTAEGSEFSMVEKLINCLPDRIARRLDKYSDQNLERCFFITVALVGVIIILSAVISALKGRGRESANANATSTFTGRNENETTGISWPFEDKQEPTLLADNATLYLTSTPQLMTPVTNAPSQKRSNEPTGPFSISDLHFDLEPTARPSLRPVDMGSSTPKPTHDIPVENTPTASDPGTQETNPPFQFEFSVTTKAPSSRPESVTTKPITYHPGNLTHIENGLLLSEGLTARIISQSGEPVIYHNGQNSSRLFHGRPDAGAVFDEVRPNNAGGWVYVSNSEMRIQDPPGGLGNGGVGAITFDKHGNILDYSMILENTTWNCGGGKTPWDTWVSCEENPRTGQLYQVSPFGLRDAEIMTLGQDGGRFESFAYDIRDIKDPYYFVTEDHQQGALQRFSPMSPDFSQDPWEMLHGNGTTSFLILKPKSKKNGKKTFRWSSNRPAAKASAKRYYPHTEGIVAYNGHLFFVSKKLKMLYDLDLDDLTYSNRTVKSGLFDGAPDQLVRLFDNHENGADESKEDLL